MKLSPLFEEHKTPWGNTEEEIVTNVGNEMMSHLNPMKELVHALQQAVKENNLEKAKALLNLAHGEMSGLADIFQKMQDYIDDTNRD
jgi:hypothetical protein